MTAQMLSNKSSLSSEKTLWSDKGSKSEVLANIYNKEKNIVIWQRKLTRALVKSAKNIQNFTKNCMMCDKFIRCASSGTNSN